MIIVFLCSVQESSEKINRKLLAQLDSTRITGRIWEIKNQHQDQILQAHSYPQILILRKTRELHRPIIDRAENIYELGSFLLISYSLPNKPEKIRRTIQRILARTPSIRLRRGIYLFPEARYRSMYAKSVHLIEPYKAFESVRKQGGKITILSRLEIVHPHGIQILETLKSQYLDRLDKICTRSSELRQEIKSHPNLERSKIQINELRSSYRRTHEVIEAMNHIFNQSLDVHQALQRTYKHILQTRKQTDEYIQTRLIQMNEK